MAGPGGARRVHHYGQAGTYTVTVTVTSAQGALHPSPLREGAHLPPDGHPAKGHPAKGGDPPKEEKRPPSFCGALLAVGLALLTLAAILGFIVGCSWPAAGTPLAFWIGVLLAISLIALGLAIALLLLWIALCGVRKALDRGALPLPSERFDVVEAWEGCVFLLTAAFPPYCAGLRGSQAHLWESQSQLLDALVTAVLGIMLVEGE